LLAMAAPAAAQKPTPHHREWLEKDVAYIISKEEKESFKSLVTEQERDNFKSRFWELRNPTPGTPVNSFKDEHYDRIAYANQHFGRGTGVEGWRSDRGRIYILLGPPKQRAFHTSHQKIRPMEIWFYSTTSPALPPFFYVVFYQRDNIGDFRLYSPYMDGPQRLITSHQAEQFRPDALRVIQEAAGREVARISLSLLPDEPVDMEGASPSLQSDVLLSTIRNLANHPLHKKTLAERRKLLEVVNFRLIHEGEDVIDVLTAPLRDAEGRTNLHYVMRLRRPGSLAVRQEGERFNYLVDAAVKVFGPDGQPVFSHEKQISRTMNSAELEQLNARPFGYAGMLPLPPGTYKVEFTLTSWHKNAAYRQTREIVVPKEPSQGLHLSSVVPFGEAQSVSPTALREIPFSVGGVRFVPVAGPKPSAVTGGELKILYQIWRPADEPRTYSSRKLKVRYVFGRPSVQGDARTVLDEVEKQQFDAGGSLVNGKKLSLVDVPPGNYRLAITVQDPETQQSAYGSLNFVVRAGDADPAVFDLFDDEPSGSVRSVADLQRGLCHLSQGRKAEAMALLERAVGDEAVLEQARSRLVELYQQEQAYDKTAALTAKHPITAGTEERTVVIIAESFAKLSQTAKAIEILETALRLREPTRTLYLGLASLHHRTGNIKEAENWERKARSLEASPN